ncbi:MAG: hypothetical protein AAF577_13245 [Pseudomonadota bacterium]
MTAFPAPLWLADVSVPLIVRLMAFRLLRTRIRRAWMRIDPYFLLTAIVMIVGLRIGFRLTGMTISVENLLSGTAVVMMLLAFALGAFTKRSDRRERRVVERKLRILGYMLSNSGRLVRIRR